MKEIARMPDITCVCGGSGISQYRGFTTPCHHCADREIAGLRAKVAELDIRRREGRHLLQRLVKRIRDNEMIVVESSLGKLAEQVADYLNRTHDPADILRGNKEGADNGEG